MFKLMKSKMGLILMLVVAMLVSSVTSYAAGPLTTAASAVSIADGIAAVIAIFGIMIAGNAVIWGIRKCTKTTNRQ